MDLCQADVLGMFLEFAEKQSPIRFEFVSPTGAVIVKFSGLIVLSGTLVSVVPPSPSPFKSTGDVIQFDLDGCRFSRASFDPPNPLPSAAGSRFKACLQIDSPVNSERVAIFEMVEE